MMGRAVIARVILPDVGFVLYELWEVDAAGRRVARRRLAPVHLVEGAPNPADLARAKQLLRDAAREANLDVVQEDD